MSFDRIASFSLATNDMPQSALDMGATLLIDTVEVAAGAASMEAGRIARDHAFAFHVAGAPEHAAHMMFDGRRASIPGAAFATATQIDNLDAHDGYNPPKGHNGCAVVHALFAFAQARPGLSARQALSALVMSYEVAARAAQALHATVSDYHTSGAWNALGVAALDSRLMGAGPDQLRQALGIAEYHGPGSQMMREIANPTMLHDGSGMGALVGSMAALLAMDGFAGAPAITVEADAAEEFWSDLGDVWTIERNHIKPYPICRWALAALDALSGLIREHGFAADDVTMIEVNTFAEAAALFPDMPATTSQAQYSLPFALAALLVHGRIGPGDISGAALSDPKVAEVLSRVAVREDALYSKRFHAGRWSDVSVMLKDGTRLASGDVQARGGPEAPMKRSEVEVKFRVMAAELPEPRGTALWQMRERLLQPEAKFSELAALVHASAEETHV
ncbi:MmgE/PrpD family protein [Ruegeria pomeroyi]|uniref:MmgE/PrpD family protein n=2 Tax=Ruegeria pomeroyi TaxID=89184 RepID=Q5LSR7_RUEPO|nr:MmgE/PrpD family protein [Ruegeria pomeroyi]AAV94983.1 MmgE/PrpD family protein [Ruegeria pomeroyi DSS-3]NVK97710.1 MmgE/PrpD family protein [Ruegeria pomeroyi]NVL03946.1 MmgE/PrpD family protein [Ruegeria pomeroyi]QWV08554.1 MmgE/PrpD family protein [Ruegeria pomeroyi]